jgi:hypothetical protein
MTGCHPVILVRRTSGIVGVYFSILPQTLILPLYAENGMNITLGLQET